MLLHILSRDVGQLPDTLCSFGLCTGMLQSLCPHTTVQASISDGWQEPKQSMTMTAVYRFADRKT